MCRRSAAVPLVLWLVFVPLIAAAEPCNGKVVGILDGDSLSVLRDCRAVKVRLYGVDAPEKAQVFGTQARKFTSDFAFQQTVVYLYAADNSIGPRIR